MTVKGLTRQRTVGRVTVEVGSTETEVQHEIGISITVHILLVTASHTSLLVHMRLTGPLEGDRRVINGRRIEVIGGQDRDRDGLVLVVAVDRVRIAARLDVDLDLDDPSGVIATPCGVKPTGTVATTVFVAVAITDTVWEK